MRLFVPSAVTVMRFASKATQRMAAIAAAITFAGAAAGEPSREQAVLEALLRYLVSEATFQQEPVKAICVAGYDVANVLLVRDRVKIDVPIVTQRSDCPKQEAQSRETAYVAVWLGAAVRISDEEYVARARVYRNPLNASERLFTLRLKDGHWLVTKSEVNWVS